MISQKLHLLLHIPPKTHSPPTTDHCQRITEIKPIKQKPKAFGLWQITINDYSIEGMLKTNVVPFPGMELNSKLPPSFFTS